MGYAIHSSCLHDAALRVYDAAGNVTESHRHVGEFKRMVTILKSDKIDRRSLLTCR
jgi:hypothetical protein